jgi:hypothetical protein
LAAAGTGASASSSAASAAAAAAAARGAGAMAGAAGGRGAARRLLPAACLPRECAGLPPIGCCPRADCPAAAGLRVEAAALGLEGAPLSAVGLGGVAGD